MVSGNSTIEDLHYILQIALGWSDDHLNRFTIHGKDYGVSHPGGIWFSDDPAQVHLAGLQLREREKFLYEYDFSDRWCHQIRVEAIVHSDRPLPAPVCLAGKRAAPPEDCGEPEVSRTAINDCDPALAERDRSRMKCLLGGSLRYVTRYFRVVPR